MEVIATHYIENLATNLLLVKDEDTNIILIMFIDDRIYVNRELNPCVKPGHDNNTLTIEIVKDTYGGYYYNFKMITDTGSVLGAYYNHFYNHVNMFSPIYAFVYEHKELFVPDDAPVLK